jgi:hypothetical protein
MQVHNAVAAHIKTGIEARTLQAPPVQTPPPHEATPTHHTTSTSEAQTVQQHQPSRTHLHSNPQRLHGMPPLTQQVQMANNYVIHNPALLNGTRCYAKTTRSAGGRRPTGYFIKKKIFSRRSRKSPNPGLTYIQRHRIP